MSDLTEHQEAWWGSQPCRECNPEGLPVRGLNPSLLPRCPNPQCQGTGWTVWASLAREPWTEIIPGLWIGGHDYITPKGIGETAHPGDLFDSVFSAYHRSGFEPHEGVEHLPSLFDDSHLTEESKSIAVQAAQGVADRINSGRSVLVRCQAGLNRSSLIAGIAMVLLGFEGRDVVQLIRTRRSPWALCNQEYADFISGLSAGGSTLLGNKDRGEERQRG